MARSWYSYVGGNPQEPSSYFRASVKPGCITGTTICAIYAPNGDTNPSPFSSNVQRYISDALINLTPQPSLPVGSKKYVYLKQQA